MTKTIKVNTVTSADSGGNVDIYGDGVGVVRLGDANLVVPDSDGTNGQVLQTNGSGTLSFTDQGGGAWEVLAHTDITSSTATVDFTFTPTNSPLFRVVITGLRHVTDDTSLDMRMSTDGGSTYITSSSHYSIGMGMRDGSSTLKYNQDQNASSFVLTSDQANEKISSGTNRQAHMIVDIPNPEEGIHNLIKYSGGWETTGGESMTWSGTGYLNLTQDCDAIRFQPSSGNILQGKFTLMQMATS